MMVKLTRKVIVRAIIGLLVLWALVIPFVWQKTSNEKLSDIPAQQNGKAANNSTNVNEQSKLKQYAKGSFRGLRGQSSSGDVSLIKTGDTYFIRLENNFRVSNGPDLLIGFGANDKVVELRDKLKANSGGQNYELPEDFNPEQYEQIFIHCRAFNYSFAVADLTKQ